MSLSPAAPVIPTPPPERLPVRLKVVHGFGSIAYGVKENGFATFLLLFYNQVVGLDAGLVGTAIMVALIADAFVDPVIGELTDRTQTRWGRRLPWLYGAPIPLAFAWMALWHPPEASDAMTIVWLVGWAIVVRSLVSMCEVPSIALVPELTGDYDERTILMRYRFLFGWAGGLLILILAYAVFFRAAGETDPAGYAAYSLTGAVLMAGAVLLSAAGQHKRIAKPSPPLPANTGGLRQIAGEMRQTLSNRAFLWLVFAALFSFVNQGIAFSLSNYMIGFLWLFDQAEKTAYALILFGTMIAAFFVVAPLARRLGKRQAAIFSGLASISFNTLLYLLYVFDVFPEVAGKPSVLLVFAIIFMSNTFGIALMILSSSMMADVVEASQSETGRRSEGLFFAGYFFMQKCATGIGIFIAGIILSSAAFPRSAAPGQVTQGVLDGLALGYVTAILVIGATGLLVLRRFPINRADHEARLAKLDAEARGDIDGTRILP
ncbi:MFS transporter [Altererythrobacter arenosus]|uniref:MFS transporter n=1 Tax=Altererythrobacter arenosus TaxID=3032592 RepID=A0ABY8FQ78_9SPHN|nr:MFS transporter [Altererythrobacter sp. CAU 1644]WFL76265.1 MFS transporter [Altererythrobacter sp. CAU 1644]